MKNSIHLIRRILFTCVAFLFINSLYIYASPPAEEIVIDNAAHCLKINKISPYYKWYKDDVLIKGAINNALKITTAGIYIGEYKNENGKIVKQKIGVIINAAGAIIKIYIIGDSTVSNYAASAYPMTGWGQVLPAFFNSANIQVDNRAIGGRSSRSYYIQGRWTPVRDLLKPGDYVFIQFGHNDRNFSDTSRYTSVADYKKYLTLYCNETKAKGAIPVLVSPMVMNAWRGTTMRNVFTETGNDYRGGMLEVATALNVAFIDLNMKSWNLYKGYGLSYITRFIYNTYLPGEYPNYPKGNNDGTHFQEMGAINNAKMITDGIKELSSRADMAVLINNLKPQFQIAVSVNPRGLDSLTTKTTSYPQGLTITLKTLPKKTTQFQKWNNAAGSQVSTLNLFKITSGTTATSYTAIYKAAATANKALAEKVVFNDNINTNGTDSTTTHIKAYNTAALPGAASPHTAPAITVNSIVKKQLISKPQLQIFPNPVTEQLTIRSSGLEGGNIKIIDGHGRIVYDKAVSGFINVSGLPSGVYSLVWIKGNERLVNRFIVVKN